MTLQRVLGGPALAETGLSVRLVHATQGGSWLCGACC